MAARMQRDLREKLVEEVQKYPMLYNTTHENHRDNDMRDRAWLEISEKLQVNSELLKREWKILRDSLRQAMKKHKVPKLSKSRFPAKRWHFEAKMAFLLPFMTKRPVHNSYKSEATIQDLKLDGDMSYEPEESRTEHFPVERTDSWGQEALDSQDGLEMFFASVCQCTRRLPRKLQAQVKRQVLDALLKAEEQAEGEDSKVAVSADFERI